MDLGQILSKNGFTMKCIFCPNEFEITEVHAEHIIPKNIGGSVLTYHVCNNCNTLFSKIDAELNKQRHIYDAYIEIEREKKPNLKFHFMEAFYQDEEGDKIQFVPISNSNDLITKKYSKNKYVFSFDTDERKDAFIGIIKKIAKKYSISDSFIEGHLAPYREFRKRSKSGDVYKERFLAYTDVVANSTKIEKKTVMNAKTPHRFIAKACAEYAHLLGISDRIKNLNLIKKHATVGGFEGNGLEFFVSETDIKKPSEYHFILFTRKQFQIIFFGKWGASVN